MVFSFYKPVENLTESMLCRWGTEKPGINIVKKSGSLSAAGMWYYICTFVAKI